MDLLPAPSGLLDQLRQERATNKCPDCPHWAAPTEKYFEAMLDRLATTGKGERNHALNSVAWGIARWAVASNLDAEEYRDKLIDAATANGLVDDPQDGPHSVAKTIESGWSAGLKHPHRLADEPVQIQSHAKADESEEERFPAVDLGALARHGVPAQPMLIDRLLYQGRTHMLHGEAGDGKTMVMLGLCAELVKSGRKVAYLDEENGEQIMVTRLLGLGLTPEQMTAQMLYLPLTEPKLAEADLLVEKIAAFEPALVCFDSGADFYVAAALKENDNDEMVAWAKVFNQRLSRHYGIACLLSEHQNREGDARQARGAGSKKQKADATWHLKVETRFDQNTVGKVEFTRTKDRFGTLPVKRVAEIGGDGKGHIIFQLQSAVTEQDLAKRQADTQRQKRQHWYREIEKALFKAQAFDQSSGLSQTQLVKLLPAGTKEGK